MSMDDKQYGTYTGSLTEQGIKDVTEGNEFQLYAAIDAFGGFLWRMRHDMGHGRIKSTEGIEKDLSEVQYSIEYCVLQARRFGVEVEEPKAGGHVSPSESYRKWYKWWKNYIEGLPKDEWKELDRKLAAGEDISMYRPEGNFSD